jgi:long-chain acyl-CoA synthetase
MADGQKYRDLCELYETSVRKFSARPLFGVREARGWHWLSYRDFASRVDTLRAALAARAFQRGDRIALIAPNCPEWAVVAFASHTLGGVLVPIYPYQRYDDWLDILQDAAPRYVFAYGIEAASAVSGWLHELPEGTTLVSMTERATSEGLTLDDMCERAFGESQAVVEVDPNDLCALIYTSGTMGRPKGVELTHNNLAANLSALHQIFPVEPDDRSLSFLPWAHAFGQVVELYGLFSMGASLGIAPSEDELVKSLKEVRPTLLFSVPKLFNRLYDTLQERVRTEGPVRRRLFEDGLDNARIRRRVRATGRSRGVLELKAQLYDRLVFERIRAQFGGRVRYAVSGGAQLAPEVAEFVDSLGITLYEGYGLTECSPVVSANWPGARKLGSVGKPLPRVKVTIDRSVGPNTRDGEIVVYGPSVMRGYHGAPEDTQRAIMPDGGLRTGDLGYMDRDGFLFVTGRIKEQYKLENGRYVVPTPLESELRSSRFVRNVMVLGDGRPHNVALIVPEFDLVREWASEQSIRASRLRELLDHPEVRAAIGREIERCSEGFRQFEKVRAFALLDRDFTIEDGTLTHTLKIRRREIAERYADLIDQLYGVHRGERAAVD